MMAGRYLTSHSGKLVFFSPSLEFWMWWLCIARPSYCEIASTNLGLTTA
ncbi:hypothetical protein JMJ77_0007931 [Colletotrichum scovillei]|uniref:Uncharacterized protein n=1 Tax=Colletotrichum scovillei TaxID=1209932 RepID=A0A9P7RH49_9PEZI|nr:hypothetical protein JMJ77_0007931 [Colletotrichum scovillei]KAG7074919.1 hypothetical protein JMJ76_0011385 [Colletotrichum scovillei]KAG7082017.1 hypothetical protein JMJ78_0004124 [Colletotrichum scovillei]